PFDFSFRDGELHFTFARPLLSPPPLHSRNSSKLSSTRGSFIITLRLYLHISSHAGPEGDSAAKDGANDSARARRQESLALLRVRRRRSPNPDRHVCPHRPLARLVHQ